MNGTEIITFIQNNASTLISPVTSIAGSIMTAIFLRKKISTETETQEFEKIKAGHLKEAADELLKTGEMTYTEYYKMRNFLDVAKRADQIHQEIPREEGTNQYDFDWFMRFYEATGTISDTELQEMWAKILAEEINYPGLYSLRTLEALRNLSKMEAILFQKICSHSMVIGNNIFLPNYNDYLECVGISFDELMKISECGLINRDSFIVLKVPVNDDMKILINNGQLVITVRSIKENKKKTLEIKQYPLTVIGKELFRVIGASNTSQDIMQFAKSLKHANEKQFDLTVNQVFSSDGNKIIYARENLLKDE